MSKNKKGPLIFVIDKKIPYVKKNIKRVLVLCFHSYNTFDQTLVAALAKANKIYSKLILIKIAQILIKTLLI